MLQLHLLILRPEHLWPVTNRSSAKRDLIPAAPSRFRGPGVHAVAGIGDPARFFATLAALGIDAEPHAFPDHHAFRPADLDFAGATAILMTAKDAVKCERFAGPAMWYLPIEATIDPALTALVVAKLRRRRP